MYQVVVAGESGQHVQVLGTLMQISGVVGSGLQNLVIVRSFRPNDIPLLKLSVVKTTFFRGTKAGLRVLELDTALLRL